jgi:hypothetical protein
MSPVPPAAMDNRTSFWADAGEAIKRNTVTTPNPNNLRIKIPSLIFDILDFILNPPVVLDKKSQSHHFPSPCGMGGERI